MKAYWKYLIIGAAIVVSAWLLARAYTYKYHAQETIVVTGLGETEFSSDLIVWNGFITAEAQNVEAGYAQIESSKKKVYDYLLSKGIAAEAIRPMAVGPDSGLPVTGFRRASPSSRRVSMPSRMFRVKSLR